MNRFIRRIGILTLCALIGAQPACQAISKPSIAVGSSILSSAMAYAYASKLDFDILKKALNIGSQHAASVLSNEQTATIQRIVQETMQKSGAQLSQQVDNIVNKVHPIIVQTASGISTIQMLAIAATIGGAIYSYYHWDKSLVSVRNLVREIYNKLASLLTRQHTETLAAIEKGTNELADQSTSNTRAMVDYTQATTETLYRQNQTAYEAIKTIGDKIGVSVPKFDDNGGKGFPQSPVIHDRKITLSSNIEETKILNLESPVTVGSFLKSNASTLTVAAAACAVANPTTRSAMATGCSWLWNKITGR